MSHFKMNGALIKSYMFNLFKNSAYTRPDQKFPGLILHKFIQRYYHLQSTAHIWSHTHPNCWNTFFLKSSAVPSTFFFCLIFSIVPNLWSLKEDEIRRLWGRGRAIIFVEQKSRMTCQMIVRVNKLVICTTLQWQTVLDCFVQTLYIIYSTFSNMASLIQVCSENLCK